MTIANAVMIKNIFLLSVALGPIIRSVVTEATTFSSSQHLLGVFIMATSTPSTSAIIARATELLSGVLSDEQIKEFVKTNKIRTFGKLSVLAEEALIANRKHAKRSARNEADAAPNTRWARAAKAKITLLVAENPKRGASAERFALYMAKGGVTVGAFLAAGGRAKDLNWDLRHGFIAIAE